MKERGIIFNSEMVRAILDGRKTQTRRVMKSQPEPSKTKDGDYWFPCNKTQSMVHVSDFIPGNSKVVDMHEFYSVCCPFGGIGDRLWVRETFQAGLCTESTFAYKATHKPSDLEEGWDEIIKWRPSIHMPRFASRITLEITDVRVERLNNISPRDVVSEGLIQLPASGRYVRFEGAQYFGLAYRDHKEAFADLWDEVSKPDWSFESNPWVWVIEFKRV
ncbi:hypothetical protein [Providencia rettgeri]|uniref:hypothetical protein n=1 Tax=Providencia rettgeri TaxID=587 RepID=UPI0015EBF7FD|nr:hypothetical protein [Providencia rettgeri]QLR05969.1 hypothetical protein H0913_06365 [Providencia rettgeri]